jgi:hypothetical protein
MNLDLLNRKHK